MIEHARCESFRCIDVRALRRQNHLRSTPSDLLWSSDGVSYNVLLIAQLDTLSVFHACLVDGVKEFATQEIPIHWAKCHFGGQRPWFNCPCRIEEKSCGRQVAKLYWTDGCFACRRCLGLAYASQRQNPGMRASRRAEKIRARLRGSATGPYRVKPRGMHWRTYRRLCEEAEHAEAKAESWFSESIERALNRVSDLATVPQSGKRRPRSPA